MKRCIRCEQTKPTDQFRYHAHTLDNLNSYCKACANKASEESRKKNPEKLKLKEKLRYERKMKRLRGEDYVVGNPENRKGPKFKPCTIDAETRRLRHNARRKFRRAVKSGKVQRLPCVVCGDENSEGHHSDYSRPLDVMWLCGKHHRETHTL